MSEMRISTQENLLPRSDIKVEAKTTWSKPNSSLLRLIYSEAPKSTALIPPEIQKLVEELVEKIEAVKRVIAIATSFPDIHWIDFNIKLKVDTELSDETWDKIQDMVINGEWKLRNHSGEKWYFRPQLVDSFPVIRNEVIADSKKKKYTDLGRLKMWSSNSPISIVH